MVGAELSAANEGGLLGCSLVMFRKNFTTEDTENHGGARRVVARQRRDYVDYIERFVIEIRNTSRAGSVPPCILRGSQCSPWLSPLASPGVLPSRWSTHRDP